MAPVFSWTFGESEAPCYGGLLGQVGKMLILVGDRAVLPSFRGYFRCTAHKLSGFTQSGPNAYHVFPEHGQKNPILS